MLTAACIAVTFTLGYACGIPLLLLTRRGQSLTETDWLWSPFIGLGSAILVVHQLVYLDVTVAEAIPYFWGSLASCWILLLFRCGWRGAFENCPWQLILAAGLVSLAHGAGLLLNGAESYFGRAYTDRFNYVSLSQFISDVPFSLSWEDLDHRVYLADGLKLKAERIGVTTLQALIACTLRLPAGDTFDATLLLGPALVVSAIALFARKCSLSRRAALATGLVAGLLPGLTIVQLSAFLGQLVGMPFLIASTVALGMLAARVSAGRLMLAAFLCATTVAIYIEFAPILFAIFLGALVSGVWFGMLRVRNAVLLIPGFSLLFLAFFPNFILASQYRIVSRVAIDTRLDSWPCYWLSGLKELGAIWVSDQAVLHRGEPARTGAYAIGILLTGWGVFGLIRNVWNSVRSRATVSAERADERILGVLAAAFGLAPLLVMTLPRFEYQAVKLLLTVSPIWALGLSFELRRWNIARAGGSVPRWWRASQVLTCCVGIATGLIMLCTIGLTLQVCRFNTVDYSLHTPLLDPSVQELRSQLEQYRGEAIVLACGPGQIWNSYLSYAARNNRVWLANPIINDHVLLGCRTADDLKCSPVGFGRELVDLSTVPSGAVVVMRNDEQTQIVIQGNRILEWKAGVFQAWRVGPGPFRLIPTAKAQRPKELD